MKFSNTLLGEILAAVTGLVSRVENLEANKADLTGEIDIAGDVPVFGLYKIFNL